MTLHDENTVETDVYQALRLRIGLFSRFDQHATSVELWSPGIPLFQEPKRSSRMRSRGAL